MRTKLLRLQMLLSIVLLFNYGSLKSQTDSSSCKATLNLGADFVNRYVWRGTDFSNSPNIQPTLFLTMSNFEIGYWSSFSTTNFYKEIDLYTKYTFKGISLILTDYYVPSVNGAPSSPDTRYFIYDDEETAHALEGSVLYKGGDALPIWLMAGTYFYGNDKRWGYDLNKDTSEETYYSSYFEAGYSFKIKDNSLDVFAGFTPVAGAYGNTAGVVNTGITGYRKIKISDSFELPVKSSIIFNPQNSNAYIIFGITL